MLLQHNKCFHSTVQFKRLFSEHLAPIMGAGACQTNGTLPPLLESRRGDIPEAYLAHRSYVQRSLEMCMHITSTSSRPETYMKCKSLSPSSKTLRVTNSVAVPCSPAFSV